MQRQRGELVLIDYGKTILTAITRALVFEECRLKPRSGRNPRSAPVSAARSCQLPGKNETSKSQSSLGGPSVTVLLVPTPYKTMMQNTS